MMIRPFQEQDTSALAKWYRQVHLDQPLTKSQLSRWLSNGRSYTLLNTQNKPIGYAVTHEVPGLPHDLDFNILVAPPHQRQGLGRQLLQTLCHDVAQQVFLRLNIATSKPTHPFLQATGFKIDHQEIVFGYELPIGLPKKGPANGRSLHTHPIHKAIPLFCQLYSASFSPHVWYQPYTLEEVQERLTPADHLIFLYQDEQILGFAWVQYPLIGLAIIEPIGIVPKAVGQGHGRFMLTQILYHCASIGIDRVQVGVWDKNETAVSLYTSLGFQQTESSTHWVLPLQP